MKTYGIINCPDCHIEFTKISPNTKRCKPCALKAHGETKTGYINKLCIVCNIHFKPNIGVQKVCKLCSPNYKKQQNILALKKRRKEKGKIPVGTILQCIVCKVDFTYKSGPQKKCTSCQKQHEIEKILQWSQRNKDKLIQYQKNARDNYLFDGNRKFALERDNFTCQHCKTTIDLQVHHIDGKGTTTPREQRNNALDNLISLCRSCHTKEHHSN
jgi:5-methylcytosine-specific restriction endonuclease McrA